jgi:ABC-2 type transport system permease protein
MRRPRPLKAVRLAALSFRLGALNALQYRADFAISLFQAVLSLGTAIGAIAVVFGQTSTLGGWSQDQLIALVAVFFVVRGLVDMVIRPSMERLMQGVRQGTLDFDLTKPADAQVLISVRQVDVWHVVDIALGFVVLVYAIARQGETVGLAGAVAFAALLLAGVAIIYSFLLILSTLAFWLVRLENILVLFASMYEAGKWPIGIYPAWLRIGLTAVVPVAFAITIPVESLTGRLDAPMLVIALVVAAAFVIGSRWFWRFGIRHYTGASA